jgi:hypothetical protein
MDGIQDRLDVQRLVALPGDYVDAKGNGAAVTNQVDLGPEPASRATQRVIRGFVGIPFFAAPEAARVARMLVPSMHHRSQSIRPSRSSFKWRRSRIRSKVPSFRHALKRWKTVW